jgi:2-polyprenyl-3-methyl-5-hydroxy-6-metoxy-1,4-benzoquinol methylase
VKYESNKPNEWSLTKSTFRLLNDVLRLVGLKIIRVEKEQRQSDPISRLVAKGLSPAAYNSVENMDSFYSDGELLTHYFTKERLRFYDGVCSRLSGLNIQPESVIDVGCGSGHLLAAIHELWPGATLRGVDFSPMSIALAERLHPRMLFQKFDIFDLYQMGCTFDLVLCTEVLEHLELADKAIDQLYSCCRPGGMIVLSVPNGRIDTFSGHVNFWTPESFCREFARFNPIVNKFEDYLLIVIRRSPALHDGPVGDIGEAPNCTFGYRVTV